VATIIAARFPLQQDIDRARRALRDAGYADDRISAFYVNEPGQHDVFPIGGDRADSPGAGAAGEGVAKGAAAGGALGAAVGAATAVVTGPAGPALGALVGAHVGSLYSLNKMKDAGQHDQDTQEDGAGDNRRAPRAAGMLIAVALDDDAPDAAVAAGRADTPAGAGTPARAGVVQLFRQLGASGLEQAAGTIRDGDWVDFDPLSVPQPVP
jgi:hypothetical protein